MPSYEIRGIRVDFPFEAYDCQIEYMSRAIEAMQEAQLASAKLQQAQPAHPPEPAACGHGPHSRRVGVTGQECAPRKSNRHGKDAVPPLRNAVMDERGTQEEAALEIAAKNELIQRGKGWRGTAAIQSHQAAVVSSQKTEAATGLPAMAPKVIYASRTHSQLAQVMGELKRASYRVKSTVLGSRQQLCVHPKVSKLPGSAINRACSQHMQRRTCPWHLRTEAFLSSGGGSAGGLPHQVLDIEELVGLASRDGPCPFVLSRELLRDADIVFVPYPYLIRPQDRKALGAVDWANTIIVFDEAHNLEGSCADATSFELSAVILGQAIRELQRAHEVAEAQMASAANSGGGEKGDSDTVAELGQAMRDMQMARQVMRKLELELAELGPVLQGKGQTHPGKYMFDFLARFGINHDSYGVLLCAAADRIPVLLRSIRTSLTRADELLADQAAAEGSSGAGGSSLQFLHECLRCVFEVAVGTTREDRRPVHELYRCHLHLARPPAGGGPSSSVSSAVAVPTLCFWCMSPGVTMQGLVKGGVRSLLLTSGTLSPLQSFAHELQLPFPLRLENPHIVRASQVWVGVAARGPMGKTLNSSYQTRDDAQYKEDLGNCIINIARVTPEREGLLVFFPSYTVMRACIQAWQAPSSSGASIWQRLARHKHPVQEPQESSALPQAVADFRRKLDDPGSKGAAFLAVCRGKVSEGLDFSDRAGRAVVLCGIPYAMAMDPRLQAKRQSLDEDLQRTRAGSAPLSGQQWYVQQAMRAVNQAMGRVIRHRNDYGAIILADERFASGGTRAQLSKWLRSLVRVYPDFGQASSSLTQFFKHNRAALGSGGSGSGQPPRQQPEQALTRRETSEVRGFDALSTAAGARPSAAQLLLDPGTDVIHRAVDVSGLMAGVLPASGLRSSAPAMPSGALPSLLDHFPHPPPKSAPAPAPAAAATARPPQPWNHGPASPPLGATGPGPRVFKGNSSANVFSRSRRPRSCQPNAAAVQPSSSDDIIGPTHLLAAAKSRASAPPPPSPPPLARPRPPPQQAGGEAASAADPPPSAPPPPKPALPPASVPSRKDFLRDLQAALPEPQFMQVKLLLAAYAESRDVRAFIDGIIQALKSDSHSLQWLPRFAPFLPASSRAWFQQLLQPFLQQSASPSSPPSQPASRSAPPPALRPPRDTAVTTSSKPLRPDRSCPAVAVPKRAKTAPNDDRLGVGSTHRSDAPGRNAENRQPPPNAPKEARRVIGTAAPGLRCTQRLASPRPVAADAPPPPRDAVCTGGVKPGKIKPSKRAAAIMSSCRPDPTRRTVAAQQAGPASNPGTASPSVRLASPANAVGKPTPAAERCGLPRADALDCPHCGQRMTDPFISKSCGHAACFSCWKERRNSKDRSCPQCSSRVHWKEVQKVYFR